MRTARPPEWTTQAACQGLADRNRDPWQGPQTPELVAEARAVCAGCPVQAECLEFALGLLERSDLSGIWAGRTVRGLKAVARDRGRAARKVAQHGTRARYVNYRCRCAECRQANARDEHVRRLSA